MLLQVGNHVDNLSLRLVYFGFLFWAFLLLLLLLSLLLLLLWFALNGC